jgi:hypothetical protein
MREAELKHSRVAMLASSLIALWRLALSFPKQRTTKSAQKHKGYGLIKRGQTVIAALGIWRATERSVCGGTYPFNVCVCDVVHSHLSCSSSSIPCMLILFHNCADLVPQLY